MSERILTTEQAAEEFFISRRLIEQWVCRRHLTPAAPGLYREGDVARVEERTRRRQRALRLAQLAVGETPQE
jgi:hypothetical protein